MEPIQPDFHHPLGRRMLFLVPDISRATREEPSGSAQMALKPSDIINPSTACHFITKDQNRGPPDQALGENFRADLCVDKTFLQGLEEAPRYRNRDTLSKNHDSD